MATEEMTGNRDTAGGLAIVLLVLPMALVVGFFSGDSFALGAVATAGMLAVFAFAVVPVSVPLKIAFMVLALTFLQKSFGYARVESVRGLNAGNVLIGGAVLFWAYRGLKTGRWYRSSPIDAWLLATVILVPVTSIVLTSASGRIPGYSIGSEGSFYKQWITAYIYYFILSQCVETRREAKHLVFLVLGLVAVAVLDDLPHALRFSSWHESRSEGFLQEANHYAALLTMTSPYLFLVLFLRKDLIWGRILVMGILGGLALSLLATYSRSGYIAFVLSLFGSAVVAWVGTRRFPVGIPVLVLAGALFVPIAAVPQVVDYVRERFEVQTYKRAKRKSYGQYSTMNQYSGDRLEIWKGAVAMARERPIFGVGFHAFETQLPKHHARGVSNYPHNVLLGGLAEGGVIWLCCLAMLFWTLIRFLYQNWKITLAEKDAWGQIVCGGAVVCFVIMLWTSMTLDFFHPGPKTIAFWVLMAAALRYGFLPPEPSRSTAAARSPESGPPLAPARPQGSAAWTSNSSTSSNGPLGS